MRSRRRGVGGKVPGRWGLEVGGVRVGGSGCCPDQLVPRAPLRMCPRCLLRVVGGGVAATMTGVEWQRRNWSSISRTSASVARVAKVCLNL